MTQIKREPNKKKGRLMTKPQAIEQGHGGC